MTAGIDHDVLAGPTLNGIDLVAVDRVRNGYPAALNDAELEHLWTTHDGTAEQARLIAAALGMTKSNVHYRSVAAKKRAAQRAT